MEIIEIPTIQLEWSDWFFWDDLKIDARGSNGVRVPNGIPGVYEAKYLGVAERLTIGKASNLRHRVKQCLVKGKSSHPAGKKMRKYECTSNIVVRWAVTDRPAAVEEELHRGYIGKFGKLPKYVKHT